MSVAVAAIVVVGTADQPFAVPVAGHRTAGPAPIDWRPCGAQAEECARIEVPLDPGQPNGRLIDIAIDRFRGADDSRSLGVLLVNPGGPGGSGIEQARRLATTLPADIRHRFDLVGFDPRGVGRSTAVRCPRVHKNTLRPDGFDATPQSAGDRAAMVEAIKNFSADCSSGSGWLLPYLGTEYAVSDVDSIRIALGQTRISYLGYSYGTVLGAAYLTRFPEHVRAMVLDGPAPADYATVEASRAQAVGFEGDIDDFLSWCVHWSCPLGVGDVGSARSALESLIVQIGSEPLTTHLTMAHSALPRHLFAVQAVSAVIGSMYSPSRWPALKAALKDAKSHDGTALLAIDDSFQRRDTHGTDVGNENEASQAIRCADDPARGRTVADAEADAASWAVQAPLVGPSNAWGEITCTWWTPSASPPIVLGPAASAPPVLMLAGTRDPATPYAFATRLATQLRTARLLTRDGDGHGSYLHGSPCVDAAVDVYLVGLTLPPVGTSCASAPLPTGTSATT